MLSLPTRLISILELTGSLFASVCSYVIRNSVSTSKLDHPAEFKFQAKFATLLLLNGPFLFKKHSVHTLLIRTAFALWVKPLLFSISNQHVRWNMIPYKRGPQPFST